MFRDSLGNVYKSLPSRPPIHHAKKTTTDRAGRKNRKNSGEWQRKVKAREAQHRAWGHKFPTYHC